MAGFGERGTPTVLEGRIWYGSTPCTFGQAANGRQAHFRVAEEVWCAEVAAVQKEECLGKRFRKET